MKVYIVYRDMFVDGLDVDSLKVFDNERDASAYYIALTTHKDYNEGYFSIETLIKEI